MRNIINEIRNEQDTFLRIGYIVIAILLTIATVLLVVAITSLILNLCGVLETTTESEFIPYVPTPVFIFG